MLFRSAHGLKSVEADTERESDAKKVPPLVLRGAHQHQHVVIGIEHEVEVLEEPRNTQADDDRSDERPLLHGASRYFWGQRLWGNCEDREGIGGYHQPAKVVHQGGAEHHHGEKGVGPAVEQIAEKGQYQVAPRPGGHQVEQQRQRQKIEKEYLGAE